MKQDTSTRTSGRPPRQSAHWPLFWALAALVVLLPAAWFLYLAPTPWGGGSRPVTFVVREGEGWRDVTRRLQQKGIVQRPITFEALVVLSDARSDLLPGRYRLHRGMSARDIISTLTSESAQARITIPEGWRLGQVGDRLVAQGLATRKQWEEALRRPPSNSVLGSRPASVSLEGYVFPDTYQLTDANAAQQLVDEGVAQMNREITSRMRAAFGREGLSVHQALTLASIVEREARVPWERPIIASVYLNRLHRGMKLQADPTVQYAVGRPGDWWPSPLTRSDLHNPSPYNTYVHGGLPPGPICSPGLPSIEAVAHPARTSYLYFVAKGDGTHAFARTYQEQLENIRRYQGR